MSGSLLTNDPRRPWAVTAGVLLGASVLAILLRVGEWIPNVTAVGALALYAGGRLRWWAAWVPPLAVMAVTDSALYVLRGWPGFIPAVYACFVIDVLVGRALTHSSTPVRVGVAGFLGALQFYLITNFAEWLVPSTSDLRYPHTAAGLAQCYIMALPFFGYTLLGNLAFSAAFFGAEALVAPVSSPEEVTETV